MGQLNKTTEKVNELLDKVDGMPSEVKDGKTPVLETGTTTTLDPGSDATSEVVANGTDDNGNPKYKLNFGIPKGYDGAGGSGGGGTADSVQWANVLNKPSWVNSATKPEYTASEVGALPASTTIPSKTSQLTNDSGFTTSASFKTINGQNIVGSGDIVIESGGGGDTPSSGGNVKVTNGSSLQAANYYVFRPSANGSTEGTFTSIPKASSTADGLMSSSDYSKLADMKSILKVPVAVLSLTDESTKDDIVAAFGMDVSNIQGIIAYSALYFAEEYSVAMPFKAFIGNNECLLSGSQSDGVYTLDFNYVDAGKLKTISISSDNNSNLSCKLSESGGDSDDTYWLSSSILDLNPNSSASTILNALGGDLKSISDAVLSGKKFFIRRTSMQMGAVIIPVSIFIMGYTKADRIRLAYTNPSTNKAYEVFYTNLGTLTSYVKVTYLDGYTLDPKVYSLKSSSTSDEISTAVGGESGLKAIIQAVKDGNRLVIRGTDDSAPGVEINQDLMCNMYQESDNGDMTLMIYGVGFSLFGGLGGLLQILYTKSSNTFSVQLLNSN